MHRHRHRLPLDHDAVAVAVAGELLLQRGCGLLHRRQPLGRGRVVLQAVGADEAYATARHAVAQKTGRAARDDSRHRQPPGQALQQLGRPRQQTALVGLVDDRRQDAVEVEDQTGAGRAGGKLIGGVRTGHG
jgi:hypothetical protein